jgi:hypothetical protein
LKARLGIIAARGSSNSVMAEQDEPQ